MPGTQNGVLASLASQPAEAITDHPKSRDYWRALALAILALCDAMADPDLDDQVYRAIGNTMRAVRV